MRPLLTVTLLALAVALSACTESPSNRAQKQLEELQKKKDAEKKAQQEREQKLRAPSQSGSWPALPAPYDEAGNTAIVPDGKCPPEFWSLFTDAPGATPEEKKANLEKKKDFEAMVRGRQYMVKLRSGDVKLNPYDAPSGTFAVDVIGTIDCTDSIGRIAIAWAEPKAGDPGASAAKEGAEVTQNVWTAPPVNFRLPMTSQTEAKDFFNKNVVGLSARVVFTLGKTEVDKKLKKIAKVQTEAAGEKLAIGGGTEDWGAGRLVRAELIGIRLASDREKTTVAEKKGP